MGGLLTVSSSLSCPHGGTVSIVSSNTVVKAGGDIAALSTDTFTVGGCSFMIGPNPHPCVVVQWVVPTTMSQVTGTATLAEDSTGLCLGPDQAPQGSVMVNSTQELVTGT
jgi:hypothetical protein